MLCISGTRSILYFRRGQEYEKSGHYKKALSDYDQGSKLGDLDCDLYRKDLLTSIWETDNSDEALSKMISSTDTDMAKKDIKERMEGLQELIEQETYMDDVPLMEVKQKGQVSYFPGLFFHLNNSKDQGQNEYLESEEKKDEAKFLPCIAEV